MIKGYVKVDNYMKLLESNINLSLCFHTAYGSFMVYEN